MTLVDREDIIGSRNEAEEGKKTSAQLPNEKLQRSSSYELENATRPGRQVPSGGEQMG